MQNGSNRFEETTMELESVSSSDDLITHASLHSDRSKEAFLLPVVTDPAYLTPIHS